MAELTLKEAFEKRFGTIENPVGLCDCGCHEYDEEQEMYDGYDPFWAEFNANEAEQEAKSTIKNTIEDVLNHPSSCNDEYIAACVRARASHNLIHTTPSMYAEAEAIIAYAKELQNLKRFW